jgi:hypothetical protein
MGDSMTALVSIIIPAHQAATFLGISLGACALQTHPELEVIVVDNGSTDGTAEVARSMMAELELAGCVVSCEQRGPGPARNEGLKHARGAYIAFLDADDGIHPEKIEAQLAVLPDPEALAMATCDVVHLRHLVPENPISVALFGRIEMSREAILAGDAALQINSVLLTRAAANYMAKTGGFLAVPCQDREYMIRTAALGVRRIHVPRALAMHRKHSKEQVTFCTKRHLERHTDQLYVHLSQQLTLAQVQLTPDEHRVVTMPRQWLRFCDAEVVQSGECTVLERHGPGAASKTAGVLVLDALGRCAVSVLAVVKEGNIDHLVGECVRTFPYLGRSRSALRRLFVEMYDRGFLEICAPSAALPRAPTSAS